MTTHASQFQQPAKQEYTLKKPGYIHTVYIHLPDLLSISEHFRDFLGISGVFTEKTLCDLRAFVSL
jgi:hypothetical protein